MFFIADEYRGNVPFSLVAAQYTNFICVWMSLSSFCEAFLIIHQDIWLVRRLYTCEDLRTCHAGFHCL